MGRRGYGGVGRGRVYTYRYTVTTRMTCIKMGSDESHFNVSLIVRYKVTRPCPQTRTFEEKGQPKRYRTEVLPLTSLSKQVVDWASYNQSARYVGMPPPIADLDTRKTIVFLSFSVQDPISRPEEAEWVNTSTRSIQVSQDNNKNLK